MTRNFSLAVLAICAACSGCTLCSHPLDLCDTEIPRELVKVTLPEYTIEPPDVLLIDAVRVVPLPPYRIEPLDFLVIQVANAFAAEPIAGLYPVDSDGTVNLGASYGPALRVAGMTLGEVKAAIEKQLTGIINKPQVIVGQGQSRALQQIRGEHLVRPDGTIGLGVYGSVRVVGMTLATAKAAIEQHLAQFLYRPEIALDVSAYNSKVYYVIFDGGGNGQQVVRLPVTGNETVLDAIAQVNGLTPVSSKHHVWVARPMPACAGCDQVLDVDWAGITTCARTATNFQLLPGDRIYVMADPWISLDTYIAKITSPLGRLFGITLLGNGTIRAVDGQRNSFSGGGF